MQCCYLSNTLFIFINPDILVKDGKAHRIWLGDQKCVRADKRLKKKNYKKAQVSSILIMSLWSSLEIKRVMVVIFSVEI